MAEGESDFVLFKQLFGTFELYEPEESSQADLDIPEDIQALLDLPFDEELQIETESKTESETAPIPVTIGTKDESESNEIKDNTTVQLENVAIEAKTVSQTAAAPRFKKLSPEDVEKIKENKYAPKTKQNTKWGINLFHEWSLERYGFKIDMETVQKDELNDYLKQFYAEAQPKITPERKRKFQDENLASVYHRNTMKNARAAINRHFREINRKMDIVRDVTFQEANDVLDAKQKANLKAGLNLPTAHKPIIPPKDLNTIFNYLKANNPIALRYRAWFILSIQFVSRGLEFHPQLNRNSLEVCTDEEGREYIRLTHEIKEKQNQSGVTNEKRIYALDNDNENCPVHNLKMFMARCDPNAEKLFCHVNKLALEAPDVCQIWYNTKPVSTKQFTSFMGDISRNAGIDTRYTAHCLRATATQGLDDAGCELRHIMFMTGHRNEASVRSYSRGTTSEQKLKMSKILTELSTGTKEISPPDSYTTSGSDDPTYENKKISLCQQDPGMGMFNPSSCTFSNCTFTLQNSSKSQN